MWQANIVIHPVLISPSWSTASILELQCGQPQTMSKLNITIPFPVSELPYVAASSNFWPLIGVNEQGFSSEKALAFLMEETDTAYSCFPLFLPAMNVMSRLEAADSSTRGNQINQAARTERYQVSVNMTKLLLPPWTKNSRLII